MGGGGGCGRYSLLPTLQHETSLKDTNCVWSYFTLAWRLYAAFIMQRALYSGSQCVYAVYNLISHPTPPYKFIKNVNKRTARLQD